MTSPALCGACGRASVSTPGAWCADCASFAGALPSPVPAWAVPGMSVFMSADRQIVAIRQPLGWLLIIAPATGYEPVFSGPVWIRGDGSTPPAFIPSGGGWTPLTAVMAEPPSVYGWVDPGIVPGVCEQCTGHMDARDGGICPSCLADPDRTRIP